MQVFTLNGRLTKSDELRQIAEKALEKYIYIYLKPDIQWVHYSAERMEAVARDTDAVLTYADRFQIKNGKTEQAPVIDYQQGSLRDDFDFGSVVLIKTDALKKAVGEMTTDRRFAGWYELRLALSRMGEFVHINEYMYYEQESDLRVSGEKQFDYVNPRNTEVQKEMEAVLTDHLKKIGGYLSERTREIDLTDGDFKYEASVVIPCKNRVRTIATAIRSALNQKTDFPYNVIVVDDNSTDGTVDEIKNIIKEGHDNLVYIAQDPTWHAIGGNWNAALHHPLCGRFALQLDSDDTYSDENTVQRFVDCFRKERCAMVVGTYRLTDFGGRELPPGVIDHKEWTAVNGHNNALRINGLGAPRGFYTPLMRQLNFPTTKYGEDYAVGLRICREYKLGRIYEVMYNCRRWDDNSDANIDIIAQNNNNLYKDRLRTWELQARIKMNRR